jgi:aldehyde dehydrogenase (NAD+)
MLNRTQFYINGAWVDPSQTNDFDVINPADESVCAKISLGSEADTNLAVGAAKNALISWGISSKEERIEVLEALYSIYKRRWSDMAEAISLEMGAPIDFANSAQAGSGAGHIKTFIEKPPDFFTKSSAPNFKPNNSSISSSLDVKKITGKDVFFLNFFKSSSPSIFGILISTTAKSGGVLERPINALSPSRYV